MNIIIAGDGEMGSHLAKLLSGESHNITMINPNKDFIDEMDSNLDIMTLTGYATQVSILKSAGIEKASLFISVMHYEEPNLLACILAKRLGAKRCIARVSNVENLQPEIKKMYNELGVDNLVSPERIASSEIIKLIKHTAADEIFDFSGGKLTLFSLKLDQRALIIDKTLREIALDYGDMGFRAVALHRKGKTIIPNGNTRFMLGDMAYIITKRDGIDQILKMSGRQKETIKNMMIVGGGRIGRNVALNLEEEVNVKLIELDKERCYALSDLLGKTLIIHGDSRDVSLLEDENIQSMDAFVSVTRDSEANILTCLLAKRYGVKKTIALIENIDFIDVAQSIGIDTIINKKLIAASYIENFAIEADVKAIKVLSGVDADVLELEVHENSEVTRSPIFKLKFPEGALIGGIVRGEEAFIADGNFQIENGDKVVVFCLPSSIKKVTKMFN
jgi:trk system potassium uptake protein TrkA